MLSVSICNTFQRSATPVKPIINDSVFSKSINMVGLARWIDAARHFYEDALRPTTIHLFAFKHGLRNVLQVRVIFSRILKQRQPFQNVGVMKKFLAPTFCYYFNRQRKAK